MKKDNKKKSKKESSVGNIYKTTDGYLSGRSDIKKGRNVAVVEQRKDDGAVIVVKIYSKSGKENKIGKNYIPNLTLSPNNHPALTEDSIVGRQVQFGIKRGDDFQSIYPRNLENTSDRLTKSEKSKVKKEVHNNNSEYRKTYRKKVKKWKNHFK